MTTLAKGLNGSNEPKGPAKPKLGPTFPSVVAEAPIASSVVTSSPARAGLDREHERAGHEESDVEDPEGEDGPQRALLDDPAVQAHGSDRLAVDGLIELAEEQLRDQHVAYDLDRPAGRAGAAPDQHERDQRQARERRPLREVCACRTRRRHHRDDLEDRRGEQPPRRPSRGRPAAARGRGSPTRRAGCRGRARSSSSRSGFSRRRTSR